MVIQRRSISLVLSSVVPWLGCTIWLGLVVPFAGAQRTNEDHAAEVLTLDGAITRAMTNQPEFAAARAEQQASALERTNARTALLPSATFHNEAIYTQPNGVAASRIGQVADAPSPIFIANNAVREYASQGVFNESVGLAQVGAIRLADANAARAAAELEVARRGLVTTVVTLYYGVGTGSGKLAIAEQALTQAQHFVEVTRKREAAREAAHADVLKAELLEQQRTRELADARLAAARARLELAVLLYPNPAQPFTLAPRTAPPLLPERTAVDTLAAKNNPALRSALAAVQISQATTYAARAALFPQLNLNVTYGIDATNVGINGPDGIHNLGYSGSAQLDIPVFDWLATERRIKQSRLREQAAKLALTSAQRHAVANLDEFYAEAETAFSQLASLDASVATARESLRLTELRYVDGESTVLEVVDAESTLTAAENAQVDGDVRYRVALASLQTLTGVL